MKTIKALLKDFLKRNESKFNKSPAEDAENIPGTNNFNNTKNTDDNEKSNHEMVGDNSVADSNPSESSEKDQGTSETQPLPKEGHGRMTNTNNTDSSNNSNNPDINDLIKEAYEKGVIDGRNSKIEETFFPKGNDGIPHFHGAPSTLSPIGDIFSMAREA